MLIARGQNTLEAVPWYWDPEFILLLCVVILSIAVIIGWCLSGNNTPNQTGDNESHGAD